MEKTTGVYWLTQVSAIYDFYQKALGSDRARKTIVSNSICPKDDDKVLDLGCGSADIFPYLGNVDYVGIDHNKDHIESAKTQFKDTAVFHCGDFSDARGFAKNGYDLILCLGLFHHLNDTQVRGLVKLVDSLLSPNGRLVSVDPAFLANQNIIARKLAEWDSGQNVRSPTGYCNLISRVFSDVQYKVHNNLLRVPYTHCITVSKKSAN